MWAKLASHKSLLSDVTPQPLLHLPIIAKIPEIDVKKINHTF